VTGCHRAAVDDRDHGLPHGSGAVPDRLNGVYGTIWFDDLGDEPGRVRQRSVTVFADGAVLRHDSIVGSTFTGTVLDTVEVDGRAAVIPQVTGMAYRTGEHVFSIDPHDPLVPGFVLR
jgi:proline racemase